MYGLPTRSDAANSSIGLFYRELQDIEIYVEDTGAEALYTLLLNRAVNNAVKIKKIICLHGRGKVVEHCTAYSDASPALFVIDGDLNLLHGDKERGLERLYQHEMYCMENYLFSEAASVELLRDSSGCLMPQEALEVLEWSSFLQCITDPLLNLFKVYAVAWKLMEEDGIKTVSRNYYDFCRKVSKARGSVVCTAKVQVVIDEIKEVVVAVHGEDKFQEVFDLVDRQVNGLENPLYAVSGKDYLLKALRDYLHFKGASYKYDDGFKFRLARHCDTTPLSGLGDAIIHTVNIGPYLQAS